MDSESYPDHLTIQQVGGAEGVDASPISERSSDVRTSSLQRRISELFKTQQGGAKKAKRSSKRKTSTKSKKSASSKTKKSSTRRRKSSRKTSLKGGKKRGDNPHLAAFRRLVDEVYKKVKAKGKTRKDAMKSASQVRKSVLLKNPALKSNPEKLTTEALLHFKA